MNIDSRYILQSGLIVGFGIGVCLVFAHISEGKFKFGYLALMFLFLLTPMIGSVASHSAGFIQVQVSGGRDPEYESKEVRKVSVEERQELALRFENQSFGLFGASALLAAGILWILNRNGGVEQHLAAARGFPWDRDSEKELDPLTKVQANGVVLILLTWIFLSAAFGG